VFALDKLDVQVELEWKKTRKCYSFAEYTKLATLLPA
jgi:hypothetical protein